MALSRLIITGKALKNLLDVTLQLMLIDEIVVNLGCA